MNTLLDIIKAHSSITKLHVKCSDVEINLLEINRIVSEHWNIVYSQHTKQSHWLINQNP